ncbi:MAG: ATP-dependent DNA helicase RecG [Patescibacteria group bacterium]
MDFNTPIDELGGVGKKTANKFEYLGVKNAEDLLYYFPFRYEDYRKIVPIAQLRAGELVTVCGQVELIANKRSFRSRKTITEALVSDKSGSVRVVWFNQPYIVKNIHPGDVVYLSGKVKTDMLGAQLSSPTYEKFKKEGTTHTARLVPIYSSTYGLSQKQIRFLISQVIDLVDKTKEWLPADILEQADLSPLAAALRGIHFPTDDNDLKLSADRLKFDELFLTQMKAELARQQKAALQAPVIFFKEDKIKDFVASLPFTLTKPQKISAWEILQDIAKTQPMNRLISGDVGSGKTVVAAMAMYDVFLNGYQAVMMAPTEILAQQHYQSLEKLFSKLNMRVGLLTGSQPAKLKREIIEKINAGELDIVVGTHALLSEGVGFYKLGLVVVDEQHRFGVEQRKLIKQKGLGTHFLSMTATPIPRSLALMIYGDLDVSIINEMPLGRKKIITKIVEPVKRNKAYQFIREQVALGRQVFVICPLIEQNDEPEIEIINYPANPANEKKSVLSEYEKLSKHIFPDLRVGYLHGKLKSNEKEAAMSKFKDGKIDLLVTTSVIEVGVDIPNASVMMIEGAENFGLAQLHQFRGRVGRSIHQSYCLLFANTNSTRASERLNFFEQTSDGFKLAEKDLEMRGPGEVYGTEQSGEMNLRLAKLTDRELIKKARDAAKTIVLNLDKYSQVMSKVKDWENRVHLE